MSTASTRRSRGHFYFRLVGLIVCTAMLLLSWLIRGDLNVFAIIGICSFGLGLLLGVEP